MFVPGSLDALVATQCFERHRNAGRLAVTRHQQMDRVTGPLLTDYHLQFSGVGYRLSVEFGDHIPGAQASLRSRRVRLNL